MVINRLEESVEPPTGKINDFQWVGKMKKGIIKSFQQIVLRTREEFTL